MAAVRFVTSTLRSVLEPRRCQKPSARLDGAMFVCRAASGRSSQTTCARCPARRRRRRCRRSSCTSRRCKSAGRRARRRGRRSRPSCPTSSTSPRRSPSARASRAHPPTSLCGAPSAGGATCSYSGRVCSSVCREVQRRRMQTLAAADTRLSSWHSSLSRRNSLPTAISGSSCASRSGTF